MIGPCLTSRPYHFSLLEWFAHYYEDVFGDLVYITDGSDACRRLRALSRNDIRYGAEVHAVDQTDTKVTVHFKTAAGTRGP